MTPNMEVRKFKDLIALKRGNGTVLGFHSRNMQVAKLTEESWSAFDFLKQNQLPMDSSEELEALQALKNWEESQNENLRKESLENGIRSLTINVTQVCNLHCKYCAAGGDGSFGDPVKRIVVNETLPSLMAFIPKVPRGHRFRLTFLGGEPLLYPEGIEILAESAREIGADAGVEIDFTVVTNGTLLNQKNIDLLKRFKMDITVSIDGPAEVNDLRRPTKGGRGMTATIEEGLKLLLSQKENLGSVMLSGVFGKNNLDLMKAYQFYRQFNVDWFDFTYDHLESSPEINQQFMSEMAQVAQVAFELEGEKGLRRIHTFDRFFNLLDQGQQLENYCGAGKSFLMLDARQNLYTCPWVVGEAKEVVGHQGQIWEGRLDSYHEPLIKKHGCQDCWARHLCGGGCMYIHRQATGDKHRVDQNYCNRTLFLIEQTLSYYEQVRAQ